MSPAAIRQYEPAERLQLDWTEFPLAKDVLYKLKALLSQGDATGEILWEVAWSKSPNLVQLIEVDSKPLVARFSEPRKKKLNMKSLASQWVGSGEHVKLRQAQYAKQLSMTSAELRKMLCDVAVTLRLHPWSLGLEAENDGRIFLPEGIILKVFTTPNLWDTARKIQEHGNLKDKLERIEFVRRFACSNERIRNEQVIPTKVIDIELLKGDIKAVVVIEHRNVGTRLKWFEENSKHMILIMTQGYGSLSTRAFLNVLHRVLPLDTKFLFFCDHDPQGSQIFTNIKYGARASAWASDSLTVPRLEYMGPTKQQLIDDQKARFVEDKWFKWKKKEAYLRKKMQVKATRMDEALIQGLLNLGVLDCEPVLAAEMETFVDGEGKFSMSLLSDGNPMAMEQFIASQVNLRIGVATTNKKLNSNLHSQDTRQFNGMASSTTDTTQSPARIQAVMLKNIRKSDRTMNKFQRIAPDPSSA